jgi:peptidoglycan-associated lipoprotein
MKRRKFGAVMVILVLCLALAFPTGCTNKREIQNKLTVTKAQNQNTNTAANEADEQAAKERTLQQVALQEQTLREQSIGKTSAQAIQEAADKTKGEMSTKEVAILKELQIPDITFEYDNYKLTPEAKTILESRVPAFLKYKEYKLEVQGHCDERGSVEYNLALGEGRAVETAKYLVNLGIDKERIKTISYGKEMPLDPGHYETAWVKNRRAHFVVFSPINK